MATIIADFEAVVGVRAETTAEVRLLVGVHWPVVADVGVVVGVDFVQETGSPIKRGTP